MSRGCGLAACLVLLALALSVQPGMASLPGMASPSSITVYVTANPQVGPAPLTVSFDAIVNGGTPPYNFTWIFGDGSMGYEKTMQHTYINPKVYHPQLAVRDVNGDSGFSPILTIVVTEPIDQIIVRIDATPREGPAPLTVVFRALVTGGTPPYTFSWNFGDGGTSKKQMDTHTYYTPGDYYAWVTVKDSSNPPKVRTSKPVKIHVSGGNNILVDASASPTSGNAPLTVSFTGSASGGSPPYMYTWDFGDGGKAGSNSALHTYGSSGVYVATLTAKDSVGSVGVSKPITITVTEPLTVSASASPTSGTAPLTVSFTGSVSGGVPPYTYLWDLGDGTVASTLNTVHTYTTPGSYTVTLMATDSSSPPNTGTSIPITVQVTPPQTTLQVVSSGSPTSGNAPLTVSFTGSASGGTPPYSYTWDFGDGSTASTNNISHTYTAAGTYTAILSARDNAAGSGSAPPILITVNVPPLSVLISGSPTSGVVPLTVSFTSAVAGGNAPYSYAWDFGDGGTSSLSDPVHTYFAAGTYSARLTVTDSSTPPQTAVSFPIQIMVNATGPEIRVDVSVDPTKGQAPLTVSFTGSASGGTPPYTYTWVFGDGSTSPDPVTTHTYPNPGIYQTYLRARDTQGDEGTSKVIDIQVTPAPLNVNVSASPRSGDAPLTVSFTSNVTGGVAPYAYSWVFGDGGTSSSSDPTYTYFNPGVYDVFLEVVDSASQRASGGPLQITVNTTVTGLNVSASASPTSGVVPLTVSFMGTVTGGAAPYTYRWVFGDGNESTDLNTSHTYIYPGVYTAYLQAWDAAARTGYSPPISITVDPASLTVNISAAPTSGTAPLTVSFSSYVSGGAPPFAYSWRFGDGGVSTLAAPTHTYVSPGVYTATLLVQDSAGQSASGVPVNITVSPSNTSIRVDISAAPTSGPAPLTVSFRGTPSGGTPPYTFEWVFGDGSTSAEQFPSHTYMTPGTYQAYLKVWDSAANYGYSTPVEINVLPTPILVQISGTPTYGNVPLTVTFTSNVSGGIPPYAYQWDLGDGGISSLSDPVYTYFNPGKFTVMLQVVDSGGVSAISNPVEIDVRPVNATLRVTASASPTSGAAPLTVAFQGYASGGSPPYSYTWTFGDGNTSSTANLSHTYTSPGTFQAYLLARDSQGNLGYSQPIYIQVSPGGGKLIANAFASPTTGPAPLDVRFTGSAAGGTPPYTYTWSFGDGTVGSGERANHTYTLPGDYIAVLTVGDSAGGKASSPQMFIRVGLPGNFSVEVSAKPTSGYPPLTVSFTSGVNGGTPPYTYTWSFGDGATSSEPSPVHTYVSSGSYDATLTVEDSTGGMAMASVEIEVFASPDIASVSVDPGSAVLKVNDRQRFTAHAKDSTGRDITDLSEFTWTVYGGVGTSEPPTGAFTTFTATTPGNGFLYVEAIYGRGKVKAYAEITVEGGPPPGPPPQVSILRPAEGDSVEGTVNVSGEARTNPSGSIISVQVRVDRGPWENATLYPGGNVTTWSFLWDTTWEILGNHSLTARAFDGNAYSPEVSVNVTLTRQLAPPAPPPEEGGMVWWLALLVVLAVVSALAITAVYLTKRRRHVPSTSGEAGPPSGPEETGTAPPAPEKEKTTPQAASSAVATAQPAEPPAPAPGVSTPPPHERRREAIRRARERRARPRQQTVRPPPPPPPPPPAAATSTRPLSPRERLERIRARRRQAGGLKR